jgi:hypothetical protein
VSKTLDFAHQVALARIGSGTAAFAPRGLAAVVELGALPLQWHPSGCGTFNLRPLRRRC